MPQNMRKSCTNILFFNRQSRWLKLFGFPARLRSPSGIAGQSSLIRAKKFQSLLKLFMTTTHQEEKTNPSWIPTLTMYTKSFWMRRTKGNFYWNRRSKRLSEHPKSHSSKTHLKIGNVANNFVVSYLQQCSRKEVEKRHFKNTKF